MKDCQDIERYNPIEPAQNPSRKFGSWNLNFQGNGRPGLDEPLNRQWNGKVQTAIRQNIIKYGMKLQNTRPRFYGFGRLMRPRLFPEKVESKEKESEKETATLEAPTVQGVSRIVECAFVLYLPTKLCYCAVKSAFVSLVLCVCV
ncbi:uncharacterized protein G2W53_024007 [Senna tora]|uniref:Uncharacterized protein n=1 Tax=Senna tora TaxID=362788 RepID=A0A834TCS1_9FABA|nr:uncharacterized protein G2W53_024007 [Senna tora]